MEAEDRKYKYDLEVKLTLNHKKEKILTFSNLTFAHEILVGDGIDFWIGEEFKEKPVMIGRVYQRDGMSPLEYSHSDMDEDKLPLLRAKYNARMPTEYDNLVKIWMRSEEDRVNYESDKPERERKEMEARIYER